MIQLSITIPTYDRPEKLIQTLRALLTTQIPNNVEILILDNASPVQVEALVAEKFPEESASIRFIRNPSNIGLAANLLRCFENAKGDWTWLLGDDDPPLPTAVATILAELQHAEPSDILFKFNSSNGGNVSKRQRSKSLEDLSARCKDARFYSNLLFISSAVFRTAHMRKNLATGYHWGYTIAPHIAILIKSMASGSSLSLVPFDLVKHGKASSDDQWNSVRLTTGFTALADIESAECFLQTAMPFIARRYIGTLPIKAILRDFLSDTGRPLEFWRLHYLRLGAIVGGWSGWWMLQLAWTLPMLIRCTPIKKVSIRMIKRRSTVEGLDRS
jgi:glycosyltransferase involved in cell wall biosynthesis